MSLEGLHLTLSVGELMFMRILKLMMSIGS